MLIVETISKIRRAHFVHQQPIKAICRDFGLSRKVVRKVLRSDATEFKYERRAQPKPKIDPWRGELDRLLLGNEGKASREKLTLIRIYEEVHGLGYAGSYDAVRRYAHAWAKERGAMTAEAFIPLRFDPGEAYQFDWSIAGELVQPAQAWLHDRPDQQCHGDGEGRACAALPQPDVLRPGLSAREPGDGVRCACKQASSRSLPEFGCARLRSSGAPARAGFTTT